MTSFAPTKVGEAVVIAAHQISRRQEYQNKSSRKTESLLANGSAENRSSGKTHFYTLASSTVSITVAIAWKKKSCFRVLSCVPAHLRPHNRYYGCSTTNLHFHTISLHLEQDGKGWRPESTHSRQLESSLDSSQIFFSQLEFYWLLGHKIWRKLSQSSTFNTSGRRSICANLAHSAVLVEAEGLATAGCLGADAAAHYAGCSFLKDALFPVGILWSDCVATGRR